MARYLEIGIEIAERIRSGELPAGTELRAVRGYAREQDTTSSTIGRAYRYLAAIDSAAGGDRLARHRNRTGPRPVPGRVPLQYQSSRIHVT